MPLLKYTLELEQPLLAAGRISDPNSNDSLDYVPGSLLRGQLIHRYCADRSDISHDEFARALFFNGMVRYLHAYLADEDGTRTLPTPHTLLKEKYPASDKKEDKKEKDPDSDWTVYNSAHPDYKPRGKQLEREKKHPFMSLNAEGDDATLYAPLRTISVHMQRNRHMGRATVEQGEIFRYQALAEGQRFIGLIVIDDGPQASEYRSKLKALAADSSAWLGGSRSAGYGRVRLTLADWRAAEAPTAEDDQDAEETILTLLSDTILLDMEGQALSWADPERLPAALAAALNAATGTSLTLTEADLDWKRSSVGRALIGGYNSTWRLPLPPAPALVAGSVIVLKRRLSTQEQTALQAQGLGLRRVEGYGRCAVNLPMAAELVVRKADALIAVPKETALTGEAARLAQRMAQRRLEQKIEANITRYLRDRTLEHPPRRSQLAWLALQAQQALNSETPQLASTVASFRQRLAERREAAKQQFERAHIDGQSLAQWLDEHLANPDTVWTTLDLGGDRALAVATIEPDKVAVQLQTTLRLIAAAAGSWRKEVGNDEHD